MLLNNRTDRIPAMKHFIAASVMLVTLVSCCSQRGVPEQIVYVARSGSMYHLSACRYLSYSRIALPLNEAVSRGYEPCSYCMPPVSAPIRDSSEHTDKERRQKPEVKDPVKTEKFRCAAFTQRGGRCKRTVKRAGERCFQHK